MSTFIIIPERPIRTASMSSPISLDMRKAAQTDQFEMNKRLLERTLDDRAQAARLRSVEGAAPVAPWRGSGSSSRKRPPRSLDALGAILVDDLSEAERAKLTESGATILENIEIQGFDPTITPSSIGTSLPEGALWHLLKVGVASYHDRGVTGAGVTDRKSVV